MIFEISIEDPKHLAGINAACKAYNESQKSVEGFVPLDAAGYVQFIMSKAAESYVKQYGA